MTFCLVPKVLDPVDVMPLFVDILFAVIDTAVMKLGDVQHIIRAKCIRVDNAVGLHMLTNDRDQRIRLGLRYDGCVYLATTL